MSSLEKLMILTQKLPNNVGDLGKIIVATGFEWLPKVQKIAQSGRNCTHLSLPEVHNMALTCETVQPANVLLIILETLTNRRRQDVLCDKVNERRIN